jgi:AbiV family abortive infection protein
MRTKRARTPRSLSEVLGGSVGVVQNLDSRKLGRNAVRAFENGIRLHADAVSLFNAGSTPSSYQLSILSMEEFGKTLALEHYLWHSAVDGKCSPEFERKFLTRLFDHRFKQRSFARQLDLPGHCRAQIQAIFDGRSETEKQNATYVGLRRLGNGKPDFQGRVVIPSTCSRKKAKAQITLVNDFLVVLGLGCIKGTHSMDLTGLEAIFTHELLCGLRASWPIMEASNRRQVESLTEMEDLPLVDRGLPAPR